jgi:hypothetical protein
MPSTLFSVRISHDAYKRMSGSKGIAATRGIKVEFRQCGFFSWLAIGAEKHVRAAHRVAVALGGYEGLPLRKAKARRAA